MPGRASQIEHVAAISKIAQLGPLVEMFRRHLAEIVGSPAFRGSRRSQDFLQHIVNKALDGRFDELKERAVGIELFGRRADYDTGEDAIVRVTASDVRRRLLHFYSEFGANSAVQIDLPSGSYIPEFRHASKPESMSVAVAEDVVVTVESSFPAVSNRRVWILVALVIGVLGLVGAVAIWSQRKSHHAVSPSHVQPWAALLLADRQTRLVLCDPDISKVQGLLDYQITLSNYANHRYLPEPVTAGPEMRKAIQTLRGVDVASIDTSIALNISELAFKVSHRLRTHTARSLQVIDFKTDDNLILLGSPRSNPWFNLFDDKLDFRFEWDTALKQEVILNAKVHPGEAAKYVPTAQGWDTGHAYGIIGFVRNPGQSGHVLLLAGSNAEATEAAGKLVTNLDLLSQVLKEHGINPMGPPAPFEILLRASTMAGSSNTFEVIACHRLAH